MENETGPCALVVSSGELAGGTGVGLAGPVDPEAEHVHIVGLLSERHRILAIAPPVLPGQRFFGPDGAACAIVVVRTADGDRTRGVTYEIDNGWVVGKLPGPNGTLVEVKHFPQGPYERRRRNNPLLCLHTTQTDGYVEQLRFPTEFQVGEDVIGQHRPLWARGSAVDEHDHDLLQVEIVEFSRLDPWLPKASSLAPLVALLALLHRRGFVSTALRRPRRWPTRLDRLPAAVDTYYRRSEVWDDPHVYGHVEIPRDEHWDPGSLDHPKLFLLVRDVLAPKEADGEVLTDNQLEGIQFANGIRRYLDSPGNEPTEPGPHRQGFRFAKRVSTHIEDEEPAPAFEPKRSSTEGMHLSPQEKHPGPEEEEAERRT